MAVTGADSHYKVRNHMVRKRFGVALLMCRSRGQRQSPHRIDLGTKLATLASAIAGLGDLSRQPS